MWRNRTCQTSLFRCEVILPDIQNFCPSKIKIVAHFLPKPAFELHINECNLPQQVCYFLIKLVQILYRVAETYFRTKTGLLYLDKIWLLRPQCRHIKAGPSTEHSKAHSVLSRWRRRRRWQSRTLLCTACTLFVFPIFCLFHVTQNRNINQTKLKLCYLYVLGTTYSPLSSATNSQTRALCPKFRNLKPNYFKKQRSSSSFLLT